MLQTVRSGPMRYRMEAAHWLTERGFGRPPRRSSGAIVIVVATVVKGGKAPRCGLSANRVSSVAEVGW